MQQPDADGPLLRRAREAAGLTRTALARAAGLSVSHVSLIEGGRRRPSAAARAALLDALGTDEAALDAGREATTGTRRALEDLAASPALADLDLTPPERLLAEHPGWAEALGAQRRRSERDAALIAAYAERLSQDPVLGDSIHGVLSAATAIRSVADIFAGGETLSETERARFDAILAEESERLAREARALAGFFDRRAAPADAGPLAGALTAPAELDDLLQDARNHFPEIEAAMARLGEATPSDATLEALAREWAGLAPRRVAEPPADAVRGMRRSADALLIGEGVPRASARFELARAVAERAAAGAVGRAVDAALPSSAARPRMERALHAYAAAALLMPYAAFREAAEALRYDVEALGARFACSPEQVCHRLTTLRRPGAEGVPFAFVRADRAGFLSKRFALPRFPIPRTGGACPLWPLHEALRAPERPLRALIETPQGERFFATARASRTDGRAGPAHALMLVCDAANAPRLAAADGLDLSRRAPARPVGSSCALCPRERCAHRQEASGGAGHGAPLP